MLVSVKPVPGVDSVRRLLSSTSVRELPRPRRLTLPDPMKLCAAPLNWLVSPSTAPLDGNCLIISSGELTPARASDSLLSTSTGSAASRGVPRISDPVTISPSDESALSSAAGGGVWLDCACACVVPMAVAITTAHRATDDE